MPGRRVSVSVTSWFSEGFRDTKNAWSNVSAVAVLEFTGSSPH
jgi:hypothetical protein